jgi:hypothetical protein
LARCGRLRGAFAPIGNGAFKPHGWDTFGYVAVTESLTEGDGVLIHGNFGLVNSSIGGRKSTWGGGSQVRIRGGFHAVGEVFSGDPYAESSGIAFQAGVPALLQRLHPNRRDGRIRDVRTTTVTSVGDGGSPLGDPAAWAQRIRKAWIQAVTDSDVSGLKCLRPRDSSAAASCERKAIRSW